MTTPTLAQYNCFHSMLCMPSAAKACCDSFDGEIVFIPAGTAAADSDVTAKLYLITYYLLCALSGTTLCTQRGLTDFVDFRLVEGKDQAVLMKGQLSPLISSARNSNISVSLEALQYVAMQANVDAISQFRIVRRFEYDFRIPGIDVIMIHLQSGENGPLHLIEVYEFRRPWVRKLASAIIAVFDFVWPGIAFMLKLVGLGGGKQIQRESKKA